MQDDNLEVPQSGRFSRLLRPRIFYGWWVLILGSLINGVGVGIFYHSFTVFFLPLKRDLGVSSAMISVLYGAARLEGGMEGAAIGPLIDRFGPRTMILIGTSLAGLGLILLSTVDNFLEFLLIYVLIVSLGSNAGVFHPVSTAITKWFVRHRGLTFSIISAAGCIGGMVFAPLLSYIILQYGWRNGAIFAGIVILAVSLPAALPIRKSPEVMGLQPDGGPPRRDRGQEPGSMHQVTADVNFAVKEALRTPHYWLLMAAITLRLLVTVALNTHFVPLLVWKGMSEATSAYLVGLSALGSIISSLALGWMGDRWSKTLLCSFATVPTVVALVGMMVSQSSSILYFFPIGFAVTMGTAPLNWALIGDFFGRLRYATLRGIMGIGYGIATFLSPIYAGWVFDRTESYTIVLLTFAIILLITASLFAFLRPPPHPGPKGAV